MLDSVIESYMRKYPTLFVNQDDMQSMKSLICALSRYIYSSYTIGKGGNQFNELYLPWYLEALGNIEY